MESKAFKKLTWKPSTFQDLLKTLFAQHSLYGKAFKTLASLILFPNSSEWMKTSADSKCIKAAWAQSGERLPELVCKYMCLWNKIRDEDT